MTYTVWHRYLCQARVKNVELSFPEGDLCSFPLYLISPHLHRCLRMTGAVSLRWERMTRSRAGGCAAAATSRPWRKKTAATRTAAPNPRPRSRRDEPATWRPHSRPSQRWPHSSKRGLGLKLLFSLLIILLNILFDELFNQKCPKLNKTANPHICEARSSECFRHFRQIIDLQTINCLTKSLSLNLLSST